MMVDRKALVAEFCELVQVDSVSGNEGHVMTLLEQKLQTLGLQTVRDQAGEAIGGECGNLIAIIPATDPSRPTVLLNAHVDTVQPGLGIVPVVGEETIYSENETVLGADDKAGVTVILAAIREMLTKPFPRGEIQVVLTIAEEIGLYGAQYLDYNLVSPHYAFVLDGGAEVGELTIGAPSARKMTWKVFGVAAHAGVHPERGTNAVRIAAEAVAEMQMGRLDEESTANIGRIEGGLARNIVPDYCEVWGEARSHDETKLAAQVAHMSRCFQTAVAAYPEACLEEAVETSYSSFRLSEEDEVVRVAMVAATNLGYAPQLNIGGGGSDANVFNAHGIPAVICACGARGAHSTAETASIPAMLGAAEWLVEMVRVSGQR